MSPRGERILSKVLSCLRLTAAVRFARLRAMTQSRGTQTRPRRQRRSKGWGEGRHTHHGHFGGQVRPANSPTNNEDEICTARPDGVAGCFCAVRSGVCPARRRMGLRGPKWRPAGDLYRQRREDHRRRRRRQASRHQSRPADLSVLRDACRHGHPGAGGTVFRSANRRSSATALARGVRRARQRMACRPASPTRSTRPSLIS